MSDRILEIDRRKFVTGVGATLAAAKAGLAGELLAQSERISALDELCRAFDGVGWRE